MPTDAPSHLRPGRTRIKICGVRRLADAALAAAAGADAVGLICYPPAGRHVPTDVARTIVAALPPFVTPVGLFVDQPIDEVRAVVGAIGLRCVQLHGHETPDYVRELGAEAVLKAIRVDRATFEAELDQWRQAAAAEPPARLAGIVLETAGPGVGGTGRANDWGYVVEVARRGGFAGLPPVIAAGGLKPDDVGQVIAAVRPWAVDVSSGVEKVRGEKDAGLIERFVAAVRAADAER